MSKKLGEFIHALLVKAGQNSDAEPIKQFFAHPELLNIDVPDELVTAIDNNLLSEAQAKENHPKIKVHYDKQVLDALDKKMDEWLTEQQVPEDVRKQIFEERSTYKRIPLLINKIKELEGKKFESSSAPDKEALQSAKEAYQKQLEELTYKLRKSVEENESIRKAADKRVADSIVKSKLTGLLSQYKTVYDDLSDDAKTAAIETLINKELMSNQAEFFLDEGENIDLRKKDSTTFIGSNHEPIKPKGFIESILSKNKLLKVSNTSDSERDDNQDHNGRTNPTRVDGNGKSQRNGALQDLVKQAEESLKQANPIM